MDEKITKVYSSLVITENGPVELRLEEVSEGNEPSRYRLYGEMMVGGLVLATEEVWLEPDEIARIGRIALRHAQEILDGKGI